MLDAAAGAREAPRLLAPRGTLGHGSAVARGRAFLVHHLLGVERLDDVIVDAGRVALGLVVRLFWLASTITAVRSSPGVFLIALATW